tara:strand:- start:39827 stop:41863 length:2037 start_codon:yes stop_codon:yes gene_type:complete
VILTSIVLAVVTIVIHRQHVKHQYFDMLEEHLQVIEDGLLPVLAIEAYDASFDELHMILRSVTQVPGVQFVELYSNIPEHHLQMSAGDPQLHYDEIRTWDLPASDDSDEVLNNGYLKGRVSHQYIYDKLDEESGRMLLIAVHQILILSLVYFAIFHMSVTRHLSTLARHLSQIRLGNLDTRVSWTKRAPAKQRPDELDIIANGIDELCQYLYKEISQREDAIQEVEASRAFYQQIVEDQAEFIVRCDRDSQITYVNHALCRYIGMDRQQLMNVILLDYFVESDMPKIQQIFEQISVENSVVQHDLWFSHPTRGKRLIHWTTRGYFDEQGQLSFLQSTGTDITEHAQTLEDLHLRNSAVQSAPHGIAITQCAEQDFAVVYVNPGFEKMTGYASEEIVGRNMRFLHRHDKDQPGLVALRDAITNGYQVEVTLRNYRKDGTQYWVELVVTPIRNAQDQVTHFVSIQTDVTERIQANERQQLMVHELDHRVKNVLATVMALAEQSLRGADDLKSFQLVFTGRVQALARSHEALAQEKWSGIDMQDLVELVMGHQLIEWSDRIHIHGPKVRLVPRLSSPLSMTLHELLTNAMKYGALKDNCGKLDLSWDISGPADQQNLQVTWKEFCPVCPGCCDGTHIPGVGMKLIEGLISYELNGKVKHHFTDAGLVCHMTVPNHKNFSQS